VLRAPSVLVEEVMSWAIVVLIAVNAPSTEVDEAIRLVELVLAAVRSELVVTIAASILEEEFERFLELVWRVVMLVLVVLNAASTETEELEVLFRAVSCPARAVSVLLDDVTRFAIDVVYAVAIAASTLEDEFEKFRETPRSWLIVLP